MKKIVLSLLIGTSIFAAQMPGGSLTEAERTTINAAGTVIVCRASSSSREELNQILAAEEGKVKVVQLTYSPANMACLVLEKRT